MGSYWCSPMWSCADSPVTRLELQTDERSADISRRVLIPARTRIYWRHISASTLRKQVQEHFSGIWHIVGGRFTSNWEISVVHESDEPIRRDQCDMSIVLTTDVIDSLNYPSRAAIAEA